MAKHWSKLVTSDFKLRDPTWPYCRPSADVEVLGRQVCLNAPDLPKIAENEVAIFKSALESWEDRLNSIAKETEAILHSFLPGKKVAPHEIVLLFVSLAGDEEPTACTFLFNVAGDYSDPSYDLEEFNPESVFEFQYDIYDGQIDWDNLTHDITNDFD